MAEHPALNWQAIGIILAGALAILGFIGWLIRLIIAGKDAQLSKALQDGEDATVNFNKLTATVAGHDKAFLDLIPELRELNKSFRAFQLEIAKEHWLKLDELEKFWSKVDRAISDRFSLFDREMNQRFIEHTNDCPLKADLAAPPLRVSPERRSATRHARAGDDELVDPGHDGG